MELNKYQELAMTTCMPSCKNISYMLLNLVGEVGEVMGWDLEGVAQMNLDKLAARKAAGTIDGDGDGISGNDRK